MHDSRRLTCHRSQSSSFASAETIPRAPSQGLDKLDDMGLSTDHAAQESNPGSLLGVAWARLPERRAARHRRDFPARWYVVAGPGRWLGLNFHIREDVRRKGPWFPTPQTSGVLTLTPRHSLSMPVLVQAKRHGTGLSFHTNIQHQPRRLPDTDTASRVDDALRNERIALAGPCGFSSFAAQSPRPLSGRVGLPAECLETGEKMVPMECAFTLPCLCRHLCEAALNPLPENSSTRNSGQHCNLKNAGVASPEFLFPARHGWMVATSKTVYSISALVGYERPDSRC